jgi:replicative DNA helicase
MNAEQLYSPAGEEALIGAVLINPAVISSLSLAPEDFYIVRHQRVYQVILDLVRAGVDPDIITVGTELDKRGYLADMGGAAGITGFVVNADMNSGNAAGYAQVIMDRAARRRMVIIAQQLATAATNAEDIHDIANRAAVELTSVSSGSKRTDHWTTFLDSAYAFAEERMRNPGDTWGIQTGFLDYDKATGGIQPGELVILSGEPGVGKSFLTLQMAIGLAKSAPGCLYSLEMLGKSVGVRAIAIESGIQASRIRSGRMEEDDWTAFVQTYSDLSELPIYASDADGWSLAELKADITRKKLQHGVKWFIVDYSYMLSDGANLSDNERTMMISSGIKRICKATETGGILIHSMNKSGMGDQNRGSSQSGLRGSAQMAYDADIILVVTNKDEINNIVTVWFKKGRELEDPKKYFELRRVGAKFMPLVRPKI